MLLGFITRVAAVSSSSDEHFKLATNMTEPPHLREHENFVAQKLSYQAAQVLIAHTPEATRLLDLRFCDIGTVTLIFADS